MIDNRFETLDFWVQRTDTLTRDQLVAALYEAVRIVDGCSFREMPGIEREGHILGSLMQNLGLYYYLRPSPGKEAIRIGRLLANIHGLKAVAA